MHIAFFLPSLANKGGVERATISLINSLSDYYHNEVIITIITFKAEDPAFPISNKVNTYHLGIRDYKKQYLLLIHKLRTFIKSSDIDVIVTVEVMSLLFSYIPIRSLKNPPKFVLWEHFNFKNNNNRKSRKWLRILAGKKLDLIVTLTERDARTWKTELKPKAKITYIYNISPFSDKQPSYKLDSKKVIAVGRYVPVKGFDRLIKAWALYEQKYGNNGWTLDIIGYGELTQQLQSYIDAEELKTINLVCDKKGISEHYSSAGIYCMSSYFEGLSMVMIEAQSFAIPSIAFDIYTGNSEILKFGSGILVEDGNIEAYADAINELASNRDLRLRMSELALQNSEQFKGYNIASIWLKELRNTY